MLCSTYGILAFLWAPWPVCGVVQGRFFLYYVTYVLEKQA
jgi:hypothetical protein